MPAGWWAVSRKLQLADGETSRTACAKSLLRGGVDEATGELLTSRALTERIGWCSDLVGGMVADLLAAHWNTKDVDSLASGVDRGGNRLPSNAWMACRRLGWSVEVPESIQVHDRIVRMAQEQAGRTLRSVKWRADVTAGVIATWPEDPAKRTPDEWDQVRESIPGGEYMPSNIIKGRTRQIAKFQRQYGRLPADLFEVESQPRTARMLLLAACDDRQGTIERADEPGRALLRAKLPTRPALGRTATGPGCPAPSRCRPRSRPVRCCTCPPCASTTARFTPTSRSPTPYRRRSAVGTRWPWASTGA